MLVLIFSNRLHGDNRIGSDSAGVNPGHLGERPVSYLWALIGMQLSSGFPIYQQVCYSKSDDISREK